VAANVRAGDSGSPVFRIAQASKVELVGILWGGGTVDGVVNFVMSPLSQIVQELGALTATK
jgi:hypothetical protein